ncbi:MAG: type II toxin-antitoxin system RelE/ParE family toxin [Lamprobacter sp.]|uniref:type II toxin-antitoxin system RelE family toxin n=1 Tax=Lamprobacter sp. TaxID=3100796 RepID=UPI002B264658|nr:type II toxin-antitoxin system RelE/ParE family toxin [Lamprobacter sp.]MEA3641659.1 type II toxin-antitoxin system RelE/ParE family toxin [Lamprobacter sp.]
MSGLEMAFSVLYHPDVKKRDLPEINENLRQRLKAAIEKRLMQSPEAYGEPLRKTLKGYWKLRVGDYRIVFRINGDEIFVLGICHRKKVYPLMESRRQTRNKDQR